MIGLLVERTGLRLVAPLVGLAVAFVAVGGFCELQSATSAERTGPGWAATPPADSQFVKTPDGYMVPYEATIPGTTVKFRMIPIPGGTFRCGSPTSEAKRSADEGPAFDVEVSPFWMGVCEVTWAEYKQYMGLHDAFKKINAAKLRTPTAEQLEMIVTAPSKLYDPSFTFQMGELPQQPAITMSQFAAKQYTKWLSGITGDFYRLPTETEWEYACRAGTTTAYSFGDDVSKLGDHAWYFDNAKDTTHPVAQKKPNPWGLFDMHGNVAEWVLDEYDAETYAAHGGKKVKAEDVIRWPTKLYPRVLRGGSWDDDADRLRSAARRASHDDDWRAEDPNLPKSPWWFTSSPALGVGFRVLRPMQPLPANQRSRYWDADIPSIREDADRRIDKEGRGSRGIADRELPAILEKLPK